LHKKKGIFTLQGLSLEEKRIIRTIEWDWMDNRDVITVLGNIIPAEHSMVLMEIKNRVDSGGVAARREIWTSEKFGIFIDYLISDKKLFRKKDKSFSLAQWLEHFRIKCLELYVGVLFDKGDNPAILETDKSNGFYSSSKQGFEYLKNIIRRSPSVRIIADDHEKLQMELKLSDSELKRRYRNYL
jgi:hypothetical protein